MSIPKPFVLTALHQVEYAVNDLSYSRRFFGEVFGEREVEAPFAKVLTNPALEIRHCGFGLTVQQLCRPLMPGLPHYDALQALGNTVHNLCFLIDDVDAFTASCRRADIESLIEFSMTDNWHRVLADDNIDGNHASYIFDTRSSLGFHLEIAETPWVVEPDPPVMLPAYGPQWSALGVDAGNRLAGLNVVVADVDRTHETLEAVFGANLTTHSRDDHPTVVELGSVRLAFHQPSAAPNYQAFFDRRGPGVHSLVAHVPDLGQVHTALASFGVDVAAAHPSMLTVSADVGERAIHARSLEQVGVDFVLAEAPA